MSEGIVEFDNICVKHVAKLQRFKHFKYWFGLCIIGETGAIVTFLK